MDAVRRDDGRAQPIPLLFLIADTGGGHRASANAVARHLEAEEEGRYDIRIVDPFAELAPRWAGQTTGLYSPIIRHAPWMWGALYHTTNSRTAVRALRMSVLRAIQPGLRRLCESLQPAAVVSFHPLLNHVTARVLRRLEGERIPFLTVITDLVDVHAAWACRDVDAVVTPSPGGMDRARRAGIPADRCHLIGLPVDASFTAPRLDDAGRRALREHLGLSPDRFIVLLAAGADGSGGLARRARAIVESDLDVDVVVICGRNERARGQIEGLRTQTTRGLEVRGFVTNMAEWTRAADVVVTKAGPGTIAETLCCGTPLLLSFYIPGQERGNVEWLVDTGAGRYVPRIDQMLDTLAELTQPQSAALERMREAVTQYAKPDATGEIADLIRSFLPRPAAVAVG